jgi:hypothetical protein
MLIDKHVSLTFLVVGEKKGLTRKGRQLLLHMMMFRVFYPLFPPSDSRCYHNAIQNLSYDKEGQGC